MDPNYQLKLQLPRYETAYQDCQVLDTHKAQVQTIAQQLVFLRPHYETVEQSVGLPWWFIGILHYLDWEFKEPDAFVQQIPGVLKSKRFDQIKTRTLGAYLWGFDLWNGFQDGVGTQSRWVWAGTNVLKEAEADPLQKVGAAAIVAYLRAMQQIDIPKTGITLQVTTSTTFKVKPINSTKLSVDQKVSVPAGYLLPIVAWSPSDPPSHLKVILPDGLLLGQNNRTEWYVFANHVVISGDQLRQEVMSKPTVTNRQISDADIDKLAQQFDLEPACVCAVLEVESSGEGFLPDGRPKILFEAAWFGKFTGDRYNRSHPDISAYTWDEARQYYKGGAAEWTRLEKAQKLDRKSALMSASWGLGQIMGFNHEACGYKFIDSFVEAMQRSEYDQFLAMLRFIKGKALLGKLQRRDWAGFALGYNGERYQENRYDSKLAAAYQKYAVKTQTSGGQAVALTDKEIFLSVPFFKQTDNFTDPDRTCFSSTCAMLLKFFKPSAIQSDDEYLRKLLTFGDTTDPAAQVKCLASYGLQVEFHTDLTFDDLNRELERGRPVPIGILHRGPLSAPTGGHWIIVWGYKGKGYWVNDPYGTVNDGYTSDEDNGRSALYSRETLTYRWCDPPNSSKGGWGLLVKSLTSHSSQVRA